MVTFPLFCAGGTDSSQRGRRCALDRRGRQRAGTQADGGAMEASDGIAERIATQGTVRSIILLLYRGVEGSQGDLLIRSDLFEQSGRERDRACRPAGLAHDSAEAAVRDGEGARPVPTGIHSSRSASIGCSRDALHAGP
jgi:hypothetical protein